MKITKGEAREILHALGMSIFNTRLYKDTGLHPSDTEGYEKAEEKERESQKLFDKIAEEYGLPIFEGWSSTWWPVFQKTSYPKNVNV